MKKCIIAVFLILPLFTLSARDSLLNREEASVRVFLEAEFGTVKLLNHTLRLGPEETATNFNFIRQGGQEILFPFKRFTAGIVITDQHRISFLYQPLKIVTQVKFQDDVLIDGTTFESGTAMEISYGFPFYRLTYGYDFFKQDNIDLGIGAAFQLRNASIVFKEIGVSDGTGPQADLTVSQNLGPVPALHLFGRYEFENGFYLLLDATGLYASSAIINGADFEFEGSILDASLRAGYFLKHDINAFINLRFLGGSAAGVSEYPDKNWTDSVTDATANYLSTLSLTLGASVR
ncbi:MAG: hypothetical protein ACLFST_10430 [Spirochaetia bacterium]